MVTLDRAGLIAALVAKGARPDRAVMYTDLFVTYREASENVARNGAIVTHPRSGSPIVNPYLAVRDAALRQLQAFKGIDAGELWA